MVNLRIQEVMTIVNRKKLIEDISFTVEKGEVLALVGHNGAGKSTLLKTIMNILHKSNGEIMIAEKYSQDDHLLQFKEHIAYLPEEPMLLSELTVMQHFQLYAMSYHINEQKFEQLLQRYMTGFDLAEVTDAFPEQLSKGMRQKTQAICSLLPDVPVLLIDEPFMGLDVYAKQYMITLIKEKIHQGTSIILTTHQLDLLEGLADSYVMLQAGKIVNLGSIDHFETISRRTDYD